MGFRRYYPTPAGKAEPRFTAGRNPAFLAWLRTLPCCVSGVAPGSLVEVPFPHGATGKVLAIIEACHIRTRGAGGPDVGNTVPMEFSQHRAQHKRGIKTFQRERGIDLQAVADELAVRWRALHPEETT